MKRIPIYISTILLTAAMSGCSQQDGWDDDTAKNKEQVMFSSGISESGVTTQTRATGGGYLAFTKENTAMKLYASATWKGHGDSNSDIVIKTVAATVSDKKTRETSHGYNDITAPLYWDDFGAGDLSNCETAGDLTTTKIAKEGLTVYGIAVDGNTLPTRFASIAYTGLTEVSDEIPVNQSGGISKEDVVISNNIRLTGSGEGAVDNRFKYVKPSSSNTKELVFRHIYDKITLNFKHGNGFTGNLPTATTVTLPGYNIKGKLDITTGEYSAMTAGTVTNLHATTASTGFEQTYEALTLPGRTFTETGTDVALTFNFADCTYAVKSSEIYKALNDNGDATEFATMKSGVHYILNITVNKSDVKLTATIADWTTVNGDLTPSNGQVVNFAGLTTNFTTAFDLYLATTDKDNTAYNNASSKTNYADPVKFKWVEETESDGVKTPAHYDYDDATKTIYWPDNNTYYHFRGLANATPTEDASGDYVTLTTKQTTSATDAYTDVIWGAPYTTASPSAISPALGPTSNEIALEFFHKMAEVEFIFKTTEGSDKVDLTTAAPTVVLNCVGTGKMLMQDGTITPGTTKSNYTLSPATGSKTTFEKIGVVPQSTVGLTLSITTCDGNVYPISDLSKIKVTGKDTYITSWAEGTKYVYTITLKKSGVEITAQIKDWNTVTAGNETIVIQ